MKFLLSFFKYFRWIYLAFFVVSLATVVNDSTSHYRKFMEYKVIADSPKGRAFVDSIKNIDHLEIAFAGNMQMSLYTREENGELFFVPF